MAASQYVFFLKILQMAKLLFVLLLFLQVNTVSMVHWEVKEPFIFGENGTLICFTNKSGTSWMKCNDVVAHHGVSFDPTKYSVLEENDQHSLLKIINVTEQDFNVTYTCLSEIYEESKLLLRTEDNFIYPPINVDKTWIVNERSPPYVTVTIGKAFPLPKCNLTHNGENIESEMELAMTKDFIYSNITINVTAAGDRYLCGGNISAICMVSSSYSIHLDTKQEAPCEHSRKGNPSNSTNFIAVISIVVSVAVLILVGIFLRLCKLKLSNLYDKARTYRSNRNIELQQKKKNQSVFCCGPSTTFDSLRSSSSLLVGKMQLSAESQPNRKQRKPLGIASDNNEMNNGICINQKTETTHL